MKYLTLCRHASAQSSLPGLSDAERTLTPIGRQEAQLTGEWVSHQQPAVELIYHSPSIRTKETAEIINQRLKLDPRYFEPASELHRGAVAEMLELVNSLPDEITHALLVGHYPGMNMLADLMTNSNTAFLSPSFAIQLELHIEDWKMTTSGCASVKAIHAPIIT